MQSITSRLWPHSLRVQMLRRKCRAWRKTAMGQSRRFDRLSATSGLPLETDIVRVGRHVSKVPRGDIIGPV